MNSSPLPERVQRATADSRRVPRVIIIGAGLSGLAAGTRLQQAGFEVIVLERNDYAGGRVRTDHRDGFIIDTGPSAATTDYVNWQQVITEVGLGDQLKPSSRVIGFVRDGRVIDVDPAKPLRALTTPALSWGAKARLAKGLSKLRPMLKGVNSFSLVASADLDDPQQNAATFAEEMFGREVADRLVDPLMRTVAGTGATQCSRLGVLGAFANSGAALINLRGGLSRFPEAMAEKLDVRYRHEVRGVQEQSERVVVQYRNADGHDRELSADACVIGATFDVAERIYPPLQSRVPGYGAQLTYLPMLSISLGYARKTSSNAYVVQVPTVENTALSLIFMEHNKVPDRAPPGHSLITCYTDITVANEVFAMTDAEAEAWATRTVGSLFPEIRDHLLFVQVTRWPVVGYLAKPGFWRNTRELLSKTPVNGRVQLAGDLFGAGSMESAVTWGCECAKRLIDQFAVVARLG